MSKKKLFNDDSDEDIDLKTENDYAKKYDSWREKEELHKLEQKYGPDVLKTNGVESSDSEDDSDEPLEVSPEVEEQFLKTLALLKTKDPRIYDPNFKYFNQEEEKKTEEKSKPKGLTFDDSDDDDDGGDIFKIEKKAEIDDDVTQKEVKQAPKKKKEKKIKEYLTGKAEHIDDEVEKDLAPLKALWSDPKLNEGEAFLRDYILNKRYLEDDDEAGEGVAKLRDDADLEADEQTVEEQSKFERAYNFRFEEPDDEYLKRFPRTMNSVRPKDDRRSRKRAEVRARKEDEKKRKMEEIARLKAFKLKEIQEKIAKIKEVTGNDELAFKEEDIEGDFDPEEHDRRMKALFDDQYYGEADGEKPVFPDLDEELEIENWDNYDVDAEQQDARNEDGPHCEDEDFNMDADYDPQRPRADLLQEMQRNLGKKKRARKRKSRLASLLAADKPAYVPARDASYARFMDEYYAMDCEDVVGGDLPTRFKYRQVLPNDYGLTVEEILMADDRELTQWVPLKRVLKQRPAAAERGERAQYARRAADRRLKRRLLPSLYRDLPEEPELAVPVEEGSKKKKKKKNNTEDAEDFNEDEVPGQKEGELQPELKQKKKKNKEENSENMDHTNNHQQSDFEIHEQKDVNEITSEVKHTKKKRRKNKSNDESNFESERVEKRDGIISRDDNLNSSIEARSKKNNENSKTTNDSSVKEYNNIEESPNKITTTEIKNNKKKKKRNQSGINGDSNNSIIRSSIGVNRNVTETKKKQRADSFVVEDVSTQGPSQESSLGNNANNRSKINNKNEHSPGKAQKRKSETQIDSIQQKKRKHNVINMSKGKKDLKTKLKQKNKFKNKNNSKKKNNTASENPLNKLSDERLKAYGLNPKKYKNFLKYKKF